MTGAPGCWALFGELNARLATTAPLREARQFSVDAYAVQHPGSPNPQAIQSVAVHLMSLYSYLELGRPVSAAPVLLQHLASAKGVYSWLTPPSFDGVQTVADIPLDAGDATLIAAAESWARSAWQAWKAHHPQIVRWFERWSSE